MFCRLTASEEDIREHLRRARQSESLLSVMEKENTELQDKLNTVTKEKVKLSRELDRAKVIMPCYTVKMFKNPLNCSFLRNTSAVQDMQNKMVMKEVFDNWFKK